MSFIALLFALNALQAGAPADPAIVVLTGRVVTGTPARPVAGALVRWETTVAATDADGRFVLRLPLGAARPASVRLNASAEGYADETVVVSVASGPVEIVLVAAPQVREDVVVSADTADVPAAPPSLVVSPSAVRAVAGALDNVFRVLQAMPGISATDDIGSRLSVRGGGPDQNLTVMDGVEIHNPYRLFGLTSAFNPETIDRFELTAGGFSARYGDRLSSILVVDNRAGTATRQVAGSAALSITDANIVLEGRLPAGITGSWLVTGRRTYYDLFAERVTDSDLPSFGDVQTKVVWAPRPGRELAIFALRSREDTDAAFEGNAPGDRIGLKNSSTNDVVSASFSTPLGASTVSRTIVSWYRYGDTLDVDGSVRNDALRSNAPDDTGFGQSDIVFTRSVGVRDISIRQELTVAATPRHTLDAGIDAHALQTDWGWRIAGDRNNTAANGSSVFGGSGLPDELDSSAPSARIGVWFEDVFRWRPRVQMAAGVRIDRSALASDTAVSPRLRAELQLGPSTRLRLAAGRYTQSPGYEKLLQSDYFVDLSGTSGPALTNEQSWHALGGLEHDLTRRVGARVEAYYKTFGRLIVGRLETPDETAARVAQYAFPDELATSVPTAPQITTMPVNSAAGSAYGFDLYLQRRVVSASDRLSGWVSYTWGRASIDSYGRQYPFDYDRRHAASVVGTWRALRRLDVSATLRVASGFPETQAQQLRVAETAVDEAPSGSAGSLVPLTDPNGLLVWTVDNGGVENLNNARLPTYARLDLRFTYAAPGSRWQLYVELINALNRENAGTLSPVLQYDPAGDRPRLTFTREQGLPLLPSFGLRLRF